MSLLLGKSAIVSQFGRLNQWLLHFSFALHSLDPSIQGKQVCLVLDVYLSIFWLVMIKLPSFLDCLLLDTPLHWHLLGGCLLCVIVSIDWAYHWVMCLMCVFHPIHWTIKVHGINWLHLMQLYRVLNVDSLCLSSFGQCLTLKCIWSVKWFRMPVC